MGIPISIRYHPTAYGIAYWDLAEAVLNAPTVNIVPNSYDETWEDLEPGTYALVRIVTDD